MTNKQSSGFLTALKSTFAAFFGVQSDQQREADFSGGKPIYFIVAGIIGTLIFIVVIIVLVKIMLASSGV